MLSLGMLTALASAIAYRSRKFDSGSAPPICAATMIALLSLVHRLPRFVSTAALRCLMFAQGEWPAIKAGISKNQRTEEPSRGSLGFWFFGFLVLGFFEFVLDAFQLILGLFLLECRGGALPGGAGFAGTAQFAQCVTQVLDDHAVGFFAGGGLFQFGECLGRLALPKIAPA